MPRKQVIRQNEFDLSSVEVSPPAQANKQRIAKVTCPMIQLDPLSFDVDNNTLVCVCTNEYANMVHAIDDHICSIISGNSVSWFGRDLSVAQVERMLVPSLNGNRHPRHSMLASKCRVFDHDMNPCGLPSTDTATIILSIDQVVFEEKRCYIQWSCEQMKLSPPPPPPSPEPEPEDDGPLFL